MPIILAVVHVNTDSTLKLVEINEDLSDEALWALANQIKTDIGWTGAPGHGAQITRYVPENVEEPS